MPSGYAALEKGAELTPHTFSFPTEELPDSQIEMDVICSGLCYSDISIITDEWTCSEYPVVPGHEVIGRITKLGSSAAAKRSDLKVGDRVGLGWHCGFCHSCRSCDEGDFNLCKTAQPTIVGHQGGFSDVVRCEYDAAVKIPEGLSSTDAAPLLCAGVTIFNPLVQYNVRPTDRVAVIGIGGLGHLAVQFLSKFGCHVTAFTSRMSKADEAKSFGAHDVLLSGSDEDIKSCEGRFDFILSTVNVPLNWELFAHALAPRGRLHFCGCFNEPIQITLETLLAQQRCMSASLVGSPKTIEKMLEFAVRNNVKPLTQEFPLAEVNTAIKELNAGRIRYRAVINVNNKKE